MLCFYSATTLHIDKTYIWLIHSNENRQKTMASFDTDFLTKTTFQFENWPSTIYSTRIN